MRLPDGGLGIIMIALIVAHTCCIAEPVTDIRHSEVELPVEGASSVSVTNNSASRQIGRGTP